MSLPRGYLNAVIPAARHNLRIARDRENMAPPVVVQFEYLLGRDTFLNHRDFVIKELCVITVEDNPVTTRMTFRPPYNKNRLPPAIIRRNLWVSRHLHGLPWDLGEQLYSDMYQDLRRLTADAQTIYCKGEEKSKFLTGILARSVTELAAIGCPKAADIPNDPSKFKRCERHIRFYNLSCAQEKGLKFANWVNELETSENDFSAQDSQYNTDSFNVYTSSEEDETAVEEATEEK